MKPFSSELFKEFPPDIPKIVTTYSSDKITILRANNVFTEPKGFGCYKFLIPSRNMPEAIVERKRYRLEYKRIFPLNPEQVHLYAEEKKVETFIPVFIQKQYLREYSHMLSGKSSLSFQNDSFRDIGSAIEKLIYQFMEEVNNKQPGYELILQSLNTQIIISLLRSVRNSLSADMKFKDYNDVKAVNLIKDFLNSHFCSDFSLHDLASFTNYSPYHLIRIFKKHTGKTPFEYLMEIKINKAKSLLVSNTCSINEISILCGFSNRTHFSTVFKKAVGVSPSQYRKQKLN